jgi:hypothetical protein
MTILNNILSKAHVDAGLSLEDDEDFIYLKKDGKEVACFNILATVVDILHEADQQVCWKKSGIEFANPCGLAEAMREER